MDSCFLNTQTNSCNRMKRMKRPASLPKWPPSSGPRCWVKPWRNNHASHLIATLQNCPKPTAPVPAPTTRPFHRCDPFPISASTVLGQDFKHLGLWTQIPACHPPSIMPPLPPTHTFLVPVRTGITCSILCWSHEVLFRTPHRPQHYIEKRKEGEDALNES